MHLPPQLSPLLSLCKKWQNLKAIKGTQMMLRSQKWVEKNILCKQMNPMLCRSLPCCKTGRCHWGKCRTLWRSSAWRAVCASLLVETNSVNFPLLQTCLDKWTESTIMFRQHYSGKFLTTEPGAQKRWTKDNAGVLGLFVFCFFEIHFGETNSINYF